MLSEDLGNPSPGTPGPKPETRAKDPKDPKIAKQKKAFKSLKKDVQPKPPKVAGDRVILLYPIMPPKIPAQAGISSYTLSPSKNPNSEETKIRISS